MSRRERYNELVGLLSQIDLSRICEAHSWVYRHLLKLYNYSSDDRIKKILAGEKLINEIDKRDIALLSELKKSVANFRHKMTKLEELKKKPEKSIENISFYWTAIEASFEEVKFSINPTAKNQIIIESKSPQVRYPRPKAAKMVEYVGFYPRSKDDLADKIGVLHVWFEDFIENADNSESGKMTMEAFYPKYKVKVKGTWSRQGTVYYLRTDDKAKGEVEIYKGEKVDDQISSLQVATQLIFNISKVKKKFLLGQMVTLNRELGFGFSASVVFFVKEDFEKKYLAEDKQLTEVDYRKMASKVEKVPADIVYHLAFQRLSTKFAEYDQGEPEELPFIDQVKILKSLHGYYKMSKLLQVSEQEVQISYTYMEIFKNGQVKFLNAEDGKNGMIRLVKTNDQSGKISLLIHLGINESRQYAQQIIYVQNHGENSTIFTGAYLIGVSESPLAGKIMLEKTTEIGKNEILPFDPDHTNWLSSDHIKYFFSSERFILPGYTLYKPKKAVKLPNYLPNELSVFCITKDERNSAETESFPDRQAKIIKMHLHLGRSNFQLQTFDNRTVTGEMELVNSGLRLKSVGSYHGEVLHITLKTKLLQNLDFKHTFGSMNLFLTNGNPESRLLVITPPFRTEQPFEIIEMTEAFELLQSNEFPIFDIVCRHLLGSDIAKIMRGPNEVNQEYISKYNQYRRANFHVGASIYTLEKDFERALKSFELAKWEGFMRDSWTRPEELDYDKKILNKFLETVENETHRIQFHNVFNFQAPSIVR